MRFQTFDTAPSPWQYCKEAAGNVIFLLLVMGFFPVWLLFWSRMDLQALLAVLPH